ncbi:hypothetical protein AMAG_12748 [Allomyces macrogynus ATCC 38327]|uniref:Phospholipid/glycerol acyltransferase domain-containing protein n=1 Tax=Allomyces macrogynus (strain ATCC 38327) TaxID=578462 RepID=A0A0L0T1Y0_ALLM3|nr:hypothetical protein AMAG_12748 [Allomyces macrogynus ATCC 38327]|eukprot:KNE68579.1 hypothetical protein AMAG_12748 [Allomyces macrogynus ATCC 38327]
MLIKTAGRRVGFLTAQKSMDRKWIGRFARAMGSIGVVRAADIAVKLPGKLWMPDPVQCPDLIEVVNVVDTDFLHLQSLGKLAVGHSLLFVIPPALGTTGPGNDVSLEIAEIVSATRIRVRRAVTDPDTVQALAFPAGLPARAAPKVDYAHMYESVFERLKGGHCVGIFPEGGSHDRSELLPFKAGVTIMALGAMAAFPGLDVKLVPVGLNYFHADRFRSRAVVEYGAPISAAVANVTVTAPDYDALMVVQAVRRLYRPLNHKLTMVQRLELTRRLMKGYLQYKDDPRVKDLEFKVKYYNAMLEAHGLQDHQVERTAVGGFRALGLLAYRSIVLLIMATLALPGAIINFPMAVAATRISQQKAAEALASSTVKIEGRDVLATWKLIVALVMVPIVYFFDTFLTWGAVRFILKLAPPWTWAIPTIVLFLGLPTVSLMALRFGERGADIYKSLAPLLMSVLPTRWDDGDRLRLVRGQLARDINDVINELGPTLFEDFNSFFMKERSSILARCDPDMEIPTTEQSSAGLKRVSSWSALSSAASRSVTRAASMISIEVKNFVSAATPSTLKARLASTPAMAAKDAVKTHDEGMQAQQDEEEGVLIIKAAQVARGGGEPPKVVVTDEPESIAEEEESEAAVGTSNGASAEVEKVEKVAEVPSNTEVAA